MDNNSKEILKTLLPDTLITRGQVYTMEYTDQNDNQSEYHKKRPYLIVSNNGNNRNSLTVNVVPLTTKFKNIIYNVEIDEYFLASISYAITNQIKTVSIDKLDKYLGTISSKATMKNIDKALISQITEFDYREAAKLYNRVLEIKNAIIHDTKQNKYLKSLEEGLRKDFKSYCLLHNKNYELVIESINKYIERTAAIIAS